MSKFELRLDADEILVAIEKAQEQGANDLSLIIIGEILKDKKTKITKMYLYGECTTEYVENIKG